jgi:hypothetical protein
MHPNLFPLELIHGQRYQGADVPRTSVTLAVPLQGALNSRWNHLGRRRENKTWRFLHEDSLISLFLLLNLFPRTIAFYTTAAAATGLAPRTPFTSATATFPTSPALCKNG